MSNFDILAILQILALIGMVYGYRKNRRDLMLLFAAVPALIVVALWITQSASDFKSGFIEGFSAASCCERKK
jgi:hypothetical protein